MRIIVIPIATIIVFVVFCIIGLMLCIKQRRKNQQVFVPRHNIVTIPGNPQFQMPMHLTQPSNPHLMTVPRPFPHPNPHVVNSVPVPFPQPNTHRMPVFQPIPHPNTHLANPMPIPPVPPVPQPFPTPSPISSRIPDPASSPDPTTQNLMDRMRQVQTLMVEIHRLESDSGERNTQRVHELKQQIVELSKTDEHGSQQMSSNLFPVNTPPPAYVPRDNAIITGPGRGDATR